MLFICNAKRNCASQIHKYVQHHAYMCAHNRMEYMGSVSVPVRVCVSNINTLDEHLILFD